MKTFPQAEGRVSVGAIRLHTIDGSTNLAHLVKVWVCGPGGHHTGVHKFDREVHYIHMVHSNLYVLLTRCVFFKR